MRRRIRDALARRLGVPEIPFALDRLAAQGFRPSLVFDVGAYRGEFAVGALARWPDADVACVEAQAARVADLDALARSRPRLRVFPVLLGAACRDRVVLHEAETASSVLTETAGPAHSAVEHRMRTVDDIVRHDYGGRAPDLLKLDVQGYELEVLKGATESLRGVGAVLAELNLLDLWDGVPLLAELVAWLDARDFVAFDICGLTRRPLDDALWQADMIFVPRASALRVDKRWCR
jgi:FkbM family methyltransferase